MDFYAIHIQYFMSDSISTNFKVCFEVHFKVCFEVCFKVHFEVCFEVHFEVQVLR